LARVDAIHGTPSATTVQVGDMVRVTGWGDLEVGTEVVASGDIQRDKNDKVYFQGKTFPFSCGEGTPELSKEQYLKAVLSDDCKATLDTYGDWTPPCDGSCGCRAVGRGSPTTLGVVLSLLGLAIGRRMRRVSRQGPAVHRHL
jgi:hypothetical protein